MPTISEFYGIVIRMYWDDHGVAHFHATYAEYEASFSIQPISLLEGSLPRRAQRLVEEWGQLHASELNEDWRLARAGQPLLPIDPLD